MILVVSASLKAVSKGRLLAAEARRVLDEAGEAVTWLDLRDHPLPLCDGGPSYDHPNVGVLEELVRSARAVLIATPIYNYDVTATVKNLVELTGDAWEDKVVGFLCTAGGPSSYMSVMSFANSLMLDFRCVIVPRFVYATGKDFAGGRIVDEEVIRRVGELARAAGRLGGPVKPA
ncbi:MAG: NADPH-dependent FMN reductase [Opitutaceae bacterium]